MHQHACIVPFRDSYLLLLEFGLLCIIDFVQLKALSHRLRNVFPIHSLKMMTLTQNAILVRSTTVSLTATRICLLSSFHFVPRRVFKL